MLCEYREVKMAGRPEMTDNKIIAECGGSLLIDTEGKVYYKNAEIKSTVQK
jgi:hypothetical protein